MLLHTELICHISIMLAKRIFMHNNSFSMHAKFLMKDRDLQKEICAPSCLPSYRVENFPSVQGLSCVLVQATLNQKGWDYANRSVLGKNQSAHQPDMM